MTTAPQVPELWINYAAWAIAELDTQAVQEVFARAVTAARWDAKGSQILDMLIAYESAHENWRGVAAAHDTACSEPTPYVAGAFHAYARWAAGRAPADIVASDEELQAAKASLADSGDTSDAALRDAIIAARKARWVAARDAAAWRAPYESVVAARTYYHITDVPLELQRAWRRYAALEQVRGTPASITALFDRACIVCAHYPALWTARAAWESAHASVDTAQRTLQQAQQLYLPDNEHCLLAEAHLLEQAGQSGLAAAVLQRTRACLQCQPPSGGIKTIAALLDTRPVVHVRTVQAQAAARRREKDWEGHAQVWAEALHAAHAGAQALTRVDPVQVARATTEVHGLRPDQVQRQFSERVDAAAAQHLELCYLAVESVASTGTENALAFIQAAVSAGTLRMTLPLWHVVLLAAEAGEPAAALALYQHITGPAPATAEARAAAGLAPTSSTSPSMIQAPSGLSLQALAAVWQRFVTWAAGQPDQEVAAAVQRDLLAWELVHGVEAAELARAVPCAAWQHNMATHTGNMPAPGMKRAR